MTRKSVETLLALVENAGQVVTKEELLAAIWPERVVEEANLTQNIAMVRRALSVERGDPAYIETFPGRGYRLAGPVCIEEHELALNQVERLDSAVSLDSQPSSTKTSSRVKFFVPSIISIVIVLVAGSWFWWPRSNRLFGAEFKIAPITRLSGEERQPAISADGKKIAYLWEPGEGQSAKICVQSVGQDAHRQITQEDGDYSSPSWAPDGRALAYLRTDKTATEVWIISLETEEKRLVTRFTPPNYGLQRRLLDWSGNGKWLVASHPDAPGKPNSLYLVDIATGEKKTLTSTAQNVGGDIDPRFSPDSQWVTFVRYIHRSTQELYSIPIVGGEPQPITGDEKQISSHDWMPGGNEIIFASDRGGDFRLWRMRPNFSQPEKNPQPVNIYGEFPIELALARNTATLVYSTQPQNRNIWRLDLQEKKWTRLIASSAQDASPQYSPDGNRICFRSDRSGEEELWVSDIDGNNQNQVTKGALYPSVGHWSPDGRQIAFNNARSGELYLASLEADAAWSIHQTGIKGVHPIFSPDGQWIYAGATDRIFRYSTKDNGTSDIVKTGGFSLGLSRDGKTLYFMREVYDTVLWQVNLETGELSKVVDGILPGCTSCWALAQNGIYYLGSNSRSFDIQALYFYDFTLGREREILKYPEPLAPVGSGPFSLSPNQKNLLCVRMDQANSDIMKVEPFK